MDFLHCNNLLNMPVFEEIMQLAILFNITGFMIDPRAIQNYHWRFQSCSPLKKFEKIQLEL